jgi:hypothetical protein
MAENLHEYKLYRKQLGLLPERDYQARALAHTTRRPGAGWHSGPKVAGKSWVFKTR